QEIKLSVVAALYKLGVCHAANQTKCFDHFTVDRIESSRVRRIPRDLPGSKNATKRYVHWRVSVLMVDCKQHIALIDDGIHVIDIARQISLKNIIRLPVAKRVKQRPQLIG